jgi:GAF domain
MPGSGPNISQFCEECRSAANLPRYAGPLVEYTKELDRAVSLRLDRADAAALDEPWNALHTRRCPRCGADLAQQAMDGDHRSIKHLEEPDGKHRLPRLDLLDPDFLATADQQTLLNALVDAALDHSPADTANVQLVDPDRRGLYIAAQHGFERSFLDFFEWVTDDGSACAAAAAKGTTVTVPDVVRSPLFTDASRQVMLDARSYAVQSFPLISSTRKLLGVFSCHYHTAGRPSDDVAPFLDALAKATTRSLQWQARRAGNGSPVTSEDRPVAGRRSRVGQWLRPTTPRGNRNNNDH